MTFNIKKGQRRGKKEEKKDTKEQMNRVIYFARIIKLRDYEGVKEQGGDINGPEVCFFEVGTEITKKITC